MPTITRTGIKSRETAPGKMPSYDRRWSRAMSALNTADDDRYLAEAIAHDRQAARNAEVARDIQQPLDEHHATVAALMRLETDTAHLPPIQPPLVLLVASPNSPNNRPAAHSYAGRVAA